MHAEGLPRISTPEPASFRSPLALAVENPSTRPGSQPPLFAGKYRLEKPLAKGGMGIVYLASQEPLGRRVAIKILREATTDSRFRDRFLAEAQICSQFAHPNIVTVHDYGEAEGALFMVMEYVSGETLDRILGRHVRLDPGRSLPLLSQIASALAHAHSAGVVHRDLKPSNIVLQSVDGTEHVKVLDFGIAKAFRPQTDDAMPGHDLTEAGKLIGTPRFMAPEQIRRQELGPQTDLYALGVLGYMVLAGRAPFDGDTDVALMNHHLYTPPPPLEVHGDVVEPELDWMLRQLLAKSPNERPPDAPTVLHQLEALGRIRELAREDLASTTRPKDFRAWVAGHSETHLRRQRSTMLRWAALVVVAIVTSGALLLWPSAKVDRAASPAPTGATEPAVPMAMPLPAESAPAVEESSTEPVAPPEVEATVEEAEVVAPPAKPKARRRRRRPKVSPLPVEEPVQKTTPKTAPPESPTMPEPEEAPTDPALLVPDLEPERRVPVVD